MLATPTGGKDRPIHKGRGPRRTVAYPSRAATDLAKEPMTDTSSSDSNNSENETDAAVASVTPTAHIIPYRFERDTSNQSIIDQFGEIEDGTETGTIVSIAGRLMLRREQGKLAFGVLADSTGRMQLFARSNQTPDFDAFTSLSLGDWIGVTGQVMKTRRGELSITVDSWQVLAETKRQFPDKWHGISDPDLRYRQRYVDLWVTDALDTELYLRIAPELYLKRLTVGGFERVFEIARVFRNEGISTRHNPEFSMLELYQAYADYGDIMELVEQLVEHLALELHGTTDLEWDGKPLNLAAPWRRASMLELIEEHTGQAFSLEQPIEELRAAATGFGVDVKSYWGPGKLLLEIYEETCESKLWDPVFVTDYPKEVSPLSRDHRDLDGFVERFEGIVAGRELCNAFSELLDPVEQKLRFEAQEADGEAGDEEAMSVDRDYIRALEYGLPPTGGLGIGMDRLVMLLTNQTNIRDVVLFPTLRPEVFG